MRHHPRRSNDFKAFKRRCRHDVFLKQSIKQSQDRAVIRIADSFGYRITVRQLKKQRKGLRRRRRTYLGRKYRLKRVLERVIRLFLRLERPSQHL